MKAKIIIPLIGVVAGSLMSACGGRGTAGPPTSQNPPPQMLDTAEVLAQARVSSETSEPYAADDGALTLTDTSESSEPINVNMM
jgi:hypothetical protein